VALLFLGYFFLGAASSSIEHQSLAHQPLLGCFQNLGEGAFEEGPSVIEGSLAVDPETSGPLTRLTLDAERLIHGRRRLDCRGGVSLTVSEGALGKKTLGGLKSGDRVRIWARLRRARGFRNPGSFDIEAYLARRGASLVGSVKSAALIELEGAPPAKLATVTGTIRRFVRARIASALGSPRGPETDRDEAPGVVLAMLVGDRSWIPGWAEKLYQRAGTLHVIAISGAHVALLALLVFGGLRRWGGGLRASLLALAAVLPLYALICTSAPSVTRAVLMALTLIVARWLSLDPQPFHALGLSALLILVFRPLDIEDPGFQLSFAATATLILFAPSISRLTPLGSRLPGRWLAVSLAAQLGVVPVAAWHFHRLAGGAVLANLVAVPAAGGLMVVGMAILLFGPVPGVGALLALAARALVAAITWSSELVLMLPGGSIVVPAPGPVWLIGYGAGLLVAALAPGRWRRASFASLALLLIGMVARPDAATPSELAVTAIDVGHGDALLLEIPGGRRVLVDGGGSHDADFDTGERVVVPFLLRRGIRRLDAVVLTHPDRDHLGGLSAVLADLEVGELWEGEPAWELAGYRGLREIARQRGVRVRSLRTRDSVRLGEATVEVLAGLEDGAGEPRVRRKKRRGYNHASLVLRVRYRRARILLTGDAESQLERKLLADGRFLRADMLKVGHHGSGSSTTPLFLDAVRPRVAVVSARRSGAFRLPSPRVLHRFRVRGIPVYRTDRDGAVTVYLDAEGHFRVESYSRGGWLRPERR
jgi:competence protein ComEC